MIVERQPRGIGLALRDPYPWDEFAELARHAETLGFSALFLPEITSRDTLAAITGLAGETSQLLLGTGVVPLPSRTPQLLAMAAATAQERSGGRLVLGLGTGPTGPGALDRLRRSVIALRAAFDGGDAEIEGERIDLSLVPPRAPRIWIAALGPRAVRMAGEVADGVLLNWCTPERVARARRELVEGAAASGRDAAQVTVGVYVRASLAQDPAAAMTALQIAAGEYASYPAYARQLATLSLADEAAAAAAAHRGRRPQDVPDRLVRETCLPTDPTRARERLAEYREAGADLPVVYPVVPMGSAAFEVALATMEPLAP